MNVERVGNATNPAEMYDRRDVMNRWVRETPNKAPARVGACLALAAVLASGCLGATHAAPLTISFSRIADTSTAVPDGSGNFSAFSVTLGATGRQSLLPSIHQGGVAFTGFDSLGQGGVYTDVGGLNRVANQNTAIPNGVGNFSFFGDPIINSGKVVFTGFGDTNPFQLGIYTNVGGLSRVADRNTAIPNGVGNFMELGVPTISGANVAFYGKGTPGGPFTTPSEGLYTNIVGLPVVADINTLVPNSSFDKFKTFGRPSIDGSNVVFTEDFDISGGRGIYSTVGGGLNVVVDGSTPIPDGAGLFNSFRAPSLDGSDVAFTGEGLLGQAGVYSTAGGLHRIADRTTTIPDGVGTFLSFLNPNLDNGNVVFGARAGSQFGIYIDIGGELSKIIDLDDLLDSKALSDLELGPEGFSGNSISFFVRFTDGSEAIYRADIADIAPGLVPEPGVLALLGLAGVILLRHRRIPRTCC